MYLSSPQIRILTDILATLSAPMAAHATAQDLRQSLTQPIAQLLNADYVASFVWDAQTQRFTGGAGCHTDTHLLREYESTYQFEDPLPAYLHPRRYPTLVTEVLPQKQLINSDFFNRFLKADHLYWGVNLYAHDGKRDLGDFRIWRQQSKQNFSTSELEILRLLYPALVGAMSRYSEVTIASSQDESANTFDHRLWQSRYHLSERQTQIAQLILAGLSDKEIAQRLNIGFTTVRTHLAAIFEKTGCANRKSLMAKSFSSHLH